MANNRKSYDSISWMSSKEAADYLGVSLLTLYKFIDTGALPGYLMGRVIRVKYDDVLSFLEGQRIGPGTLNSVVSDVD